MSDLIVLDATRREITGKKVKTLRRDGKLPAVLYGQGMEPLPITLEAHATSRLMRGITLSTLITINLDGEEYAALVRERQYDVIKRVLSHLDFLVVSMTDTLRTSVPLRVVGESPAIQEYNAMIMQESEVLEIEALPGDLPESVEIDVSGLMELGSNISVADIDLGDKVTILSEPDMVIAVAIAATRLVEEEEEEVDELAEEGVEPEVIERGKREEDDEE